MRKGRTKSVPRSSSGRSVVDDELIPTPRTGISSRAEQGGSDFPCFPCSLCTVSVLVRGPSLLNGSELKKIGRFGSVGMFMVCTQVPRYGMVESVRNCPVPPVHKRQGEKKKRNNGNNVPLEAL